MKHVSKMVVFLVTVGLLYTCSACSHAREVLYVYSIDYPQMTKLTSEEINIEDIQRKNSMLYEYFSYTCYVSKTNTYEGQSERLVVNNIGNPHVMSFFGDGGYVVGMDYTEFAAGMIFYPYTGESIKSEALLEDRCIAFLPVHIDGYETGRYCYAVTTWNKYTEDESSYLYKILFPHDMGDRVGVEKICRISSSGCDEAIAAVMADSGLIYVATEQSLYIVTIDGKVESIHVPDAWMYMGVNSMVSIDESLYIGTQCGILRYEVTENRFDWFPVEYEKMVSEGTAAPR